MCATLTLSLFMFLLACLSYGVLYYLHTFNFTFIQIGSETAIFLQVDQFLLP